MELRPEQFEKQLAGRPLAPVYLLAGDEPLLVLEAADALRAKARDTGYTEREVLHAEPGFDWGQLTSAGASLSLFAEKRILELHLPDKGPGKPGSTALSEYAKDPPETTLLLVIATPLASSARKTAWYRALTQAGASMYAWPLDTSRMPGWIGQRARRQKLEVTREAAELLAARTEGNLLACAQEIDRLALLHGAGRITADDVLEAASDHARFGIFDLPAKALDGDARGALKSLERLREEGVDAVPILWALVREIRLLYQASQAARQNRLDAMLKKVFMPPARKRQLAQAARRSDPDMLARLLLRAGHADRIHKGAQAGRGWDELVTLTLGLSGVALRRAVIDPQHDRL